MTIPLPRVHRKNLQRPARSQHARSDPNVLLLASLRTQHLRQVKILMEDHPRNQDTNFPPVTTTIELRSRSSHQLKQSSYRNAGNSSSGQAGSSTNAHSAGLHDVCHLLPPRPIPQISYRAHSQSAYSVVIFQGFFPVSELSPLILLFSLDPYPTVMKRTILR